MDIGDADFPEITFTDKDDKDFIKKCGFIVKGIQAGKLTFVELIEKLGTLLTSDSYCKRELGVWVISEVLTKLPSDCLNSQQISVIATYLCEKSKDHHQVVVATLKGILALVQFKNISSDSVIFLLNSVFQNVTCQQQQQPDRHTIFQIFQKVLQNHLTVIKSLGLDFVYGIISAIDGERDPKNLLFLFNWILIFIKNVSLGHLSEEMFQVLACYFPVDFKAPPQDSNRITREALSAALCPCLTAIPEFAEFCLPLALEKLDSSLKIAKKDSLQLLKRGCENFDVTAYMEHSSEIWSQLQKEVLNASDPELQKECLDTFCVVINKLSTSNDEMEFEKILHDISDTLKGNLLPNSKLFNSSAAILISVASASAKSALLVTKKLGPLLENTFSITNNVQEKIVILNALIGFFKAFVKHHRNFDVTSIEELSVIPILCLQSLSSNVEEDLRITAFNRLVDIAEFVPDNIRNSLFEILHIEIVTRRKNKNLRESVLRCLKKFASLHHTDVKDKVLYKEEINDVTALDMYLNSIAEILDLQSFTETCTNILLRYSLEENVQKSTVALQNIRMLLNSTNDSVVYKAFLDKDVIRKLIRHVMSCQDDVYRDYGFLTDVRCILKILIGCMAENDRVTQGLLVNNEIENVEKCCKKYENVYVALLSGLLIRVHRNVVVDCKIINNLVDLAINGCDKFCKEKSVELLANMVNKISDESVLKEKLELIKETCFSFIEVKTGDVIVVFSWVTKALLMANHEQAHIWSEMLINLLETHSEVAEGFRIIMNDSYEDLNTISNCNKMLLYRQKFFVMTTDKINTMYKPNKVQYLNAIGYLIENAPKQAVTMQFEKISKLVIQCLEKCTDPEVLYVLLETIKAFITNKEVVIENHIEELLPKILALTTFQYSMKVRVSALCCLQEITENIPTFKLLPLKQAVIQHLLVCLDDKKRLVRKQAMEARSLWFLIDAPF